MNSIIKSLHPVDVESINRITNLEPPTLIIVESKTANGSLEIATHMAKTWSRRPLDDIKIVSPEKDYWTVTEVQDKIIAPTNVIPDDHNFIIINNAEDMPSATSEKLLKTIEEPNTPTTFLFCVTSTRTMKETILSRATAVLTIVNPPKYDVSLLASELEIEEYKVLKIMEIIKDETGLLPILAEHPELMNETKILLNPAPLQLQKKPSLYAYRLNKTINKLANLLNNPESDIKETLDSNAKPASRQLAKKFLTVYKKELSILAAQTTSPIENKQYKEKMLRIDDCIEQISSYSKIQFVITSALI